MTPAWLRPLTEPDLVEHSRYYGVNAGDDVAARFFDAAIKDNLHQEIETWLRCPV